MSDTRFPRRKVLKTVMSIAAMTPIGALAQQKVSKESVKYRDKPNGEKRCGNCEHFAAPNACAIVEGRIDPQGYCVAWSNE